MKPCLLVSSPQMKDPFFERTVVLLWHHDDEGAIGVVVNKPVGQVLADVLSVADTVDLSMYAENQVGWGGPVEAGSGTVVTRGLVTDEEGWPIEGGLSVTRSQDALLRLLGQEADVMLCLGYAGWGPGQLDREIEAGGWICTEARSDIVFDEPAEARYDLALATLGLTAATVWMTPISE